MKKESESKQMYLKTILRLEKTRGRVRNIDIAMELGCSKPSVTVAVRKLAADGMARIKQNKSIALTKEGKEVAEKTLLHYEVLRDFFESLGADRAVAEENACSMEHQITDELFALIQNVLLKKYGVGIKK